jgi:chemotaxis protein MotB
MKKSGVLLVSTLAAAALAAGGCVSKGEFEKAQAEKSQEIDALQKERSALEQQTRDLQTQRKALEDQKVALERQQTNLRSELDTLARQKAQLEAANQQTKSQYDGLLANLNEEVKKGQLQVRQYKDMLTVEVAEQLFFDSGRAALKDQGKDVLKRVGEALKGYEDKMIRVVGHTDNVPISTSQFPSNWELSAARATTVVRFLQSAGVPPERMTASGRGEFSPIAPNDDADGRKKNRRIEITLIDRNLAQEVQEKR